MLSDCEKAITYRKSIRHFKEQDVDIEVVYSVIEAARWAPSGLNNQPWRFAIVKSREVKEKIANLSHYKRIFLEAPVLIPFFIDKNSIYDREKDLMGVGAAVENMLLKIHHLNLGGVWLGEILKAKEEVEKILEVSDNYEFLGIVAFGYPNEKDDKPRKRKDLTELIIREIL